MRPFVVYVPVGDAASRQPLSGKKFQSNVMSIALYLLLIFLNLKLVLLHAQVLSWGNSIVHLS